MNTSFDKRLVRYEHLHAIDNSDFRAMVAAADVKNGFRVLDCGCGYGACTRELLSSINPDLSLEITLLDESRVQLESSCQELQKWSHLANLQIKREQATFPDDYCPPEYFDLVFAKMVLHEQPEHRQRSFLEAIKNCLRPGGQLLLWELCLTDMTANFFRKTIREKDRVLNFDTLVNNRHFPIGHELCELLESVDFMLLTPIKKITYYCDTRLRLQHEFANDEKTYFKWLDYVRKIFSEEAEKHGMDELHNALHWEDHGDHVIYRVSKSIFSAHKQRSDSCIHNHSSNMILSERSFKKLEAFPAIAGQTIRSAWEDGILDNRNAMVRTAVLTRSYGPNPELCREGLDYLCNYQPNSKELEKQILTYLAYLVGVYCSAHESVDGGAQGMSGVFIKVLEEFSGTAWLVVHALNETAEISELEVIIGGYSTRPGLARISSDANLSDFYDQVGDHLKDVTFQYEPLDSKNICRVVGVGGTSLDDLAEQAALKFLELWKENVSSALRKGWQVDVSIARRGLREICDSRVSLLNLQQYLARSGTPYTHYFAPPSQVVQLEEEKKARKQFQRVEQGTLVVATEELLYGSKLEKCLSFLIRLWGGLGNREAFLAEKYQQEKLRERERAIEELRSVQGGIGTICHHVVREMQTSGIWGLYNEAQKIVKEKGEKAAALTAEQVLAPLENLFPAWGISEMGAHLNRQPGYFRNRWRGMEIEGVELSSMGEALHSIIRSAFRNYACDEEGNQRLSLIYVSSAEEPICVDLSAREQPKVLPPFGGKSAIDSPGTLVVSMGLYELLRNGCSYLKRHLDVISAGMKCMYYRCLMDEKAQQVRVEVFQPHMSVDVMRRSKMVTDIQQLEQSMNRPEHTVVETTHYQKAAELPFLSREEHYEWYCATWIYNWSNIAWEDRSNVSKT